MPNGQTEHDSHVSSPSAEDDRPPPWTLTAEPPPRNSSLKKEPESIVEELSLKEEKTPNVFKRWYARLCQRWTLALMLFFSAAALTLALGHGLFFVYLNNSVTEHRRIHQSHVTAISFLLTTAFKACISAAVGVSFTQYLWRILRQQLLSIGCVEHLFSLRSNPFELARVRFLLIAPPLLCMGLFLWILPIAVVYPPSALTVSFRPYIYVKNVDVPILFPSDLRFFEPANDFVTPRLSALKWYYTGEYLNSEGRILKYANSTRILARLARASLLSADIAQFQAPIGENASYSLEFTGPQLSCDQTAEYISGNWFEDSVALYSVVWRNSSLSARYANSFLVVLPTTPLGMEWYHGVFTTLTCQPVLAKFNVSVSYVRSERHISYTVGDYQSLPPPKEVKFAVEQNTWPKYPVPKEFNDELHLWEKWAILDASLATLKYNATYRYTDTLINKGSEITLLNGTILSGLEPKFRSPKLTDHAAMDMLDWSVFDTEPWVATLDRFRDHKINLTEKPLNEYLARVTIGAMSLNLGQAKTPVNFTEYRTTYHFSDPINLILPYALSLLVGAFFVAIGIWALDQNGAAAIDGGFLQIMATTIGRSKMEKLIVEHHPKLGGDSVPKEVLDLKIRYGELVDDEGVGTGIAGFGTEKETKMLRKGWASG